MPAIGTPSGGPDRLDAGEAQKQQDRDQDDEDAMKPRPCTGG